jgi:hypothetical protein
MMMENNVRLVEAVLSFISSLVWPAVILFVVWHFREQISYMILNIKSFKNPFGEFEFVQPQRSGDIKPLKKTATQEKYVDPRGFYTKDGLSKLITESGLIQVDEKVVDMVLIFETLKQHTWIITTNLQLFCVLDDEDTRSSGRMIQWKMLLSDDLPIRARISERGNPVVDIGERKGWLYSRHLFPIEEALEKSIKSLIERGRK